MNTHPQLHTELARGRDADRRAAAERSRAAKSVATSHTEIAPVAPRGPRAGLGALMSRIVPVRAAAPDQRC